MLTLAANTVAGYSNSLSLSCMVTVEVNCRNLASSDVVVIESIAVGQLAVADIGLLEGMQLASADLDCSLADRNLCWPSCLA